MIIQACGSNFMVTDPSALLIGDIVTCVVSDNYIGSGREKLADWKPSDLDFWRNSTPDALFGEHFGDFAEWGADCSMILGVSSYAEHAP